MKRTTACFLAAMTALAPFATNGSPLYRAPLTVSGYAGAEDLVDFPVLVRISPERISGFSYADCERDGSDISFALGDGSLLAHEVDTWNEYGESLVWVRLPTLSSGTTFHMYWGDRNPPSVTASDVWSAGYAGVWHLGETGTGGTSANSTANGSVLDGENTPTTAGVAGKVGGGRQISDSTSTGNNVGGVYVDGSQDCTRFNGVFTISGWFWHRNQAYYYDHLFYKREAAKNASGGIAIEMNKASEGIAVRGGNNTSKAFTTTTFKNKWSYLAFVYNGTTVTLYQDGVSKGSGAIGQASDNNLRWVFGNDIDGYGGAAGDVSWKGVIDEVRLRAGVTSADWAKAEYATMANAQFLTWGGAEKCAGDDFIMVTATGVRYGTVTPAYGFDVAPVDGRTYTFSCATSEEFVNAEENTKAVCTGWKLYSAASGTLLRSSDDPGEGLFSFSHTYSAGTPVEVVWQWQIQYLVAATATGGGSVAPAGQWIPKGGTATIEATRTETAELFGWTGVAAPGLPTPKTVRTTVTAPLSVTATFAPVCHVALDGDDENDGTTWATAKATVTNAMAACAGGGVVLEIGAGTFPVQKTLALSTNLRIIGQGTDATILDFGALGCRGANMSHGSALLCDLTISNAVGTAVDGGGINMSNGTVRRCRITYCRTALGSNSYVGRGGGIWMSGGTVADSEIDHCWFYGGYNYGNAIHMTGGTVTNCDIHANNNTGGLDYHVGNHAGTVALYEGSPKIIDSSIHHNTFKNVPGVYIRGAGIMERCHVYANRAWRTSSDKEGHGGSALHMTGNGTVRNCLFEGNDSGTYTGQYDPAGGAVLMTAGTLAYCTIVANTNVNDTAGRKGITMSGGTAVGNIFWGNTGNNKTKDMYVTAGTFATNLTGVTEVSPAAGNFVADPRFVDFAGGDYTLRASSPCIDRGPTYAWMATALDFAGNPRIQPLRNGRPDLGCFESDVNRYRRTIMVLR